MYVAEDRAWGRVVTGDDVYADLEVASKAEKELRSRRTTVIVGPVQDERIHQKRLVIGDAFGEGLLACHAGGGVPGVAFELIELIERSDGHLGVMDAARYFAPDDDWTATTRFARERAVGRILDIGAGAGRVAVVLQDEGYDVVPSTRAGNMRL